MIYRKILTLNPKILRAGWKNEMEAHVEKLIPRILPRHFKKIKNELNN
jgi:hypothetical protein